MSFDKFSFSSANTYPLKVLMNRQILELVQDHGKVPSIHYQINPTNRCNFKCSFCSCSGRNRKQELRLSRIDDFLDIATRWECQAVTITGGGEPMAHKNWGRMVELFNDHGVDTGLVTNGTLLDKGGLDDMVWVRVSASDYLEMELKANGLELDDWFQGIDQAVHDHGTVDWAFSYVVGRTPNHKLISWLVEFANAHDFTHIRLVNDIFRAGRLTWTMTAIENHLKLDDVDDGLVNYQDRSVWTPGSSPCYLSLLKPVIGADGYIYPCCGTQYALKDPSRDYEKAMRMGKIEDLDDIIDNQKFFDGSMCWKCYYSQYNEALAIMMSGLKHETFV